MEKKPNLKEIELKAEVVTFSVGESWRQTSGLRYKWIEEPINEQTAQKVLKLQQLWQSNIGNQEWRNVPIEEYIENK